MKNLKIRILLPLLFGLMVIVSLVQGGIAIRQVDAVSTHMEALGSRMERSIQIADIEAQLGEVRRLNLMILNASNAGEKRKLVDALTAARESLDASVLAFDGMVALPTVRERFDVFKGQVAQYESLGVSFVEQALASKLYQAKDTIAKMGPVGDEAGATLHDITAINREIAVAARAEGKAAAAAALHLSSAAVLCAALIALAAAVFSFARIVKPIGLLTGSMRTLAAGDTASVIPFGGRHDELGEMAEAVGVFRPNAIERVELERQAEQNRSLSESERLAREAQKAQEAAEVQFAVDALAGGLQRLSDGDLAVSIDARFSNHLDALR
ncbi:MAG: MCP four helix bundle domain-containing protein, partial [Rhizobium sp.]|nr:MCP four helix bundle domain-containing protein [Rhizobium sp.]